MFAWTTPWRKPRTATTRLSSHRLLDELLLDEGLRRDRLANHAARNRVPGGGSGWGDGRDRRRGLRRSGSLGGRGPAGRLASRGWDLDDGRSASTAARRALDFAHERSALVADVGRHGVEGAARWAWLRAHLAHLLFLAEPVFERHEGGLFLPPLLEIAVREIASKLLRSLLMQFRHDFVVLQTHLLPVVRHFDLAGRELDPALRALFHVDRDPSLAVRALRHVLLELDAALRTGRRVLRDERTALATLDHLAEAVDFPVHRDAGDHPDGRTEDDQEKPPGDAEDRDRAAEERQSLLHRDRLGLRPDDAGRWRDDDVVRTVRESRRQVDRAEEEPVALGDGRVGRHDGGALSQFDRESDARDPSIRALIPDIPGDAQRRPRLERLARCRREHRDVAQGRLHVQRDRRRVVRFLRGSALVDPVVRIDPEEDLLVAGEGNTAHIQ